MAHFRTNVSSASRDLAPAIHGGLLVSFLTFPLFIKALSWWPLYFLVPLLAYALVVCLFGPLRRTVSWLRVGRLDPPVIAATIAISVLSCSALLLYSVLFPSEPLDFVEPILSWSPAQWVLAGVLFSVLNGLFEEVIFRGILMHALRSEVGLNAAIIIQSVAFGLGHAHGYPPGAIGIVLASIYGLVLGLLRLYAQGMAAPILAHVTADATIFAIVMTDLK